jgi:aryl-alcohol dehydrogenase-like predicted oxidoreductase
MGPDRTFGAGDQRLRNPRFSTENRTAIQRFIDAIQPLAAQRRLTVTQIVLAWTLTQPGCSHVLAGARTPDQVRENAGGGAVVLDPQETAAIASALDSHLRKA